MESKKALKRILISRTDSIGDVMLTLPLCGVLKAFFPETKIIFAGRSYTEAVAHHCKHIDQFLDVDKLFQDSEQQQIETIKALQLDAVLHVFPLKRLAFLSKKAGVPLRIGASGRWYHWLSCNRIVALSRRRSALHEAQLNLKLLQGCGIRTSISLDKLDDYTGWQINYDLQSKFTDLLDKQHFNLILHPRSKGSAREWGLDNFARFANLLPRNAYKVFVTGTQAEGELIQPLFEHCPWIVNLCGKMTLDELIEFIGQADGLVAASTGPLHLAAASGIVAVGIYPPMMPMHPGRWKPIGKQAIAIVQEKSCIDCRKTEKCHCMEEISPEHLFKTLNQLRNAGK